MEIIGDEENYRLCGLLLDYLSLSSSLRSSRQSSLPSFQFLEVSQDYSSPHYAMAIYEGKGFLPIDFQAISSRFMGTINGLSIFNQFLNLQSSVEIYSIISNEKSLGNISGQISSLSKFFPFASILILISKYKLNSLTLTGFGWSGTIAHNITILLREFARTIKLKIPIRCVSFSGPLCGSKSIEKYLWDNSFIDLHVTINSFSAIYDRLLMNYQQLSLLYHCEIDSWRSVYEFHYQYLVKFCHHPPSTISQVEIDLNLTILSELEDILYTHPLLNISNRPRGEELKGEMKENENPILYPIGKYLFFSGGSEGQYPTICRGNGKETLDHLRHLTGLALPRIPPSFSLSSDLSASIQQPTYYPITFFQPTSTLSPSLVFTPVISSVHIIQYSHHSSLIFEGTHLDMVLCRDMLIDIPISLTNPSLTPLLSSPSVILPILPFFLTSSLSSLSFHPNAKIHVVRSIGPRLIIDITGLSITAAPPSLIEIGIRNDFGESNTLSFSTTRLQIGKEKDDTHSPSIHPIMNTTFLVATLLRVAVCMRASTVTNFENEFPQLNTVWNSLVDMENLCEYSSTVFPTEMNRYVRREYSLNYLQNIVKKRVENMLSIITSYHENDDEKERERERNEGESEGERRERGESMSRFIPSPRRVIGGLSRLTGGLISTAGVILAVPSMLLSLPALLYITRQNRESNSSLQIGIGPGIYLSLMGLLSLPGVIVTGLGSVLSVIGKNIMKEDNETSNYRTLLYEMISLLDIDTQRENEKREIDNSSSSSNPDKSIEYIIDEIIPLENYVIELWCRLYPMCDITSSLVSPQDILQHIQQISITTKRKIDMEDGNSNELNDERRRIISQKLLRNSKKNPALFIKLKFIGYVYRIRAVFESHLYISLFGTSNASKSLLLSRLFDLPQFSSESHTDSSDPSLHRVGDWIEKYSSNSGDFHEIFRSWINDHDRASFQLYVLDHPFVPLETCPEKLDTNKHEETSDEVSSSLSSSILSLTSTAEYLSLSSLVLLVLTELPHQLTPHTLQYLNSIRSSQKPFLVILDLTQLSFDDGCVPQTPGEYESLKEAYSRKFDDVSIDLIHFIDQTQESIDRLRGLLYGMGQNLLVSAYHIQLLALRLIPANIIQQLVEQDKRNQTTFEEDPKLEATCSVDILSFPDLLCSATTSLLYNLSRMTPESLRATSQHLWTESKTISQETPEKNKRSLQSLPLNISLQVQQIMISLQISENIYSLFQIIFTSYFNLFADSFQSTLSSLSSSPTQNLSPQLFLLYHIITSNKQVSMETILSIFILLFMRQHINAYLGIQINQSKIGDKDQMNVSYLCTEILLGFQIWVNTWTEKGYHLDIIEKGIAIIFMKKELTSTFILSLSPTSSSHCISDQEFLQVINRLQNTSKYFQTLELDEEDSKIDLPNGGSLVNDGEKKMERLIEFELARDQYAQIMKIISFQPFPQLSISPLVVSSSSLSVDLTESHDLLENHELSLEMYQEFMKEYTQQHNQTIKIVLSRNTEILLLVLEQLMSYSYQDMKKSSFLFTVMSESAVDLNGVTRSIMTQLAIEINSQPKLLFLQQDEESRFIYFDPEKFIPKIEGERRGKDEGGDIHTLYSGFGKLIGLCIVKASVGVTFPVDFPLTFYRLILGCRLTMNDLVLVHPQIASSLINICLMDEETLQLSCLDFTITRSDHSVHELIPNGSNHIVTIHNRVEYIKKTLQYYLCCSESQCSLSDETGFLRSHDESSPFSACHSSPLLSFLFGIQSICSRHYFHHMTPMSLQLLIEGDRKNINVKEWKEFTEYRSSGTSLFTTTFNPSDIQTNLPAVSTVASISANTDTSNGNENQRTIEIFWDIVNEMSDIDKRKLLCFTVGTTSLPSNGFQGLQPKFTLVVGTMPSSSLPISHTCFHMLILPKYETKEIMKAKLSQAIQETGVSDLGIV